MKNSEEILANLAEAIVAFDSERLKESLKEALNSEIPVDTIIKKGLGKGMEIVGKKYEEGEFFLSELIMSSVVMNEAMEQLKPILKKSHTQGRDMILIGTVEGDLHDIGKNLVKYMLESAGYEVIDLGVDVAPARFVEKAVELKPKILCMSALLSITVPKVKHTIEALENAGMRRNVKVLVGGRCLSKEMAEKIGADAYGEDAWDGLKKAQELLEQRNTTHN